MHDQEQQARGVARWADSGVRVFEIRHPQVTQRFAVISGSASQPTRIVATASEGDAPFIRRAISAASTFARYDTVKVFMPLTVNERPRRNRRRSRRVLIPPELLGPPMPKLVRVRVRLDDAPPPPPPAARQRVRLD